MIMDDSDESVNFEWEGKFLGEISHPKFSIYLNNAYYVINNTSIWEKQRILDMVRAKEILEYQNELKSKCGNHEFLVPFYIANYKGNYLTFDGQHRLAAINLLSESEQKKIEILVFYFECNSETEIIQYF